MFCIPYTLFIIVPLPGACYTLFCLIQQLDCLIKMSLVNLFDRKHAFCLYLPPLE